ncbi:MAG: helix-turn-helix domain-containing protein [Gemmatimonadota bacterium]
MGQLRAVCPGRGRTPLDAGASATRQLVLQAWEQSGYNQTQAARLLGIPRTTFQTYVQKFDLGSP